MNMLKITRGILMDHLAGLDGVAKKPDGTWKLMRGFFYSHGMDGGKFALEMKQEIQKAFPGVIVTLLKSGEQWKPFRGGDSVAKGSHFWALVKIEPCTGAFRGLDTDAKAVTNDVDPRI